VLKSYKIIIVLKVIQRISLAPSKFNNHYTCITNIKKLKLAISILNVMLNAKFCHRKEQFGIYSEIKDI